MISKEFDTAMSYVKTFYEYKWTSGHGKTVLLVLSRIRHMYDSSKILWIWFPRYWSKCKQSGWKYQYIQWFYIRFFKSAISDDHWIEVSFLKQNYCIYLWRNHINCNLKNSYEHIYLLVVHLSISPVSHPAYPFSLSRTHLYRKRLPFDFMLTSSYDWIGDGTTKREGNRFLSWEINYQSCDPLTHFLVHIDLVLFCFFLFFPYLSHSIFFPSFFINLFYSS